jgi:hypothetical protein
MILQWKINLFATVFEKINLQELMTNAVSHRYSEHHYNNEEHVNARTKIVFEIFSNQILFLNLSSF